MSIFFADAPMFLMHRSFRLGESCVGKIVSVLDRNRWLLGYTGALLTGCDPRKMLVNVATTYLAHYLEGGFTTPRSAVRSRPPLPIKSITYGC